METESTCGVKESAVEIGTMGGKGLANEQEEVLKNNFEKARERMWLQPPNSLGDDEGRRNADLGAWDLWKLSAPV